jgi:hypothetical protein
MPSKAVVDAVEARIGSTWNSIPVRGVNVGSDVPDDAATFIVVEYPIANVTRMGLGPIFQEEGAFRIVLNTERGEGIAQTLTWADQLAALFRDQSFGGIRSGTPSPPTIDDSNDRGSFFQVSLSVPFTYDFREA